MCRGTVSVRSAAKDEPTATTDPVIQAVSCLCWVELYCFLKVGFYIVDTLPPVKVLSARKMILGGLAANRRNHKERTSLPVLNMHG